MDKHQLETATYDISLDDGFHCTHEHVVTKKACCPPGTQDCDCAGVDQVRCLNPNCDGFPELELDYV